MVRISLRDRLSETLGFINIIIIHYNEVCAHVYLPSSETLKKKDCILLVCISLFLPQVQGIL